MPTKKRSKSATTSKPSQVLDNIKRHWIRYAALLLLLALVVKFIGVPLWDWRRVKQLDGDMAYATRKIVSLPGVTAEQNKHCQHTQEKFGPGPLFCNLAVRISLSAQNEQELSAQAAKIRGAIASSGRFSLLSSPETPRSVFDEIRVSYTNTSTRLSCWMSPMGTPGDYGIDWVCTGGAYWKYYPEAKYGE